MLMGNLNKPDSINIASMMDGHIKAPMNDADGEFELMCKLFSPREELYIFFFSPDSINIARRPMCVFIRSSASMMDGHIKAPMNDAWGI
ncbi:hypothetical protein CEXT_490141 [Caerostris extrusa]|uniref:Uncharacterized protein n=1 Tax=Caerostris extrusa TaxID=172846 RepID=A0AAV4WXS1_CAEEX|nr:hypothetical protein CEXT_490141 [Caerostris extrusa]